MLKTVICALCVFFKVSVLEVEGTKGRERERTPNYLWPLGNTTVYQEVMQGHDAQLPDSSQCFVFQQGYPGLPYDAIELGKSTDFLDFRFAGEINFQDLSLSFYIYPEESSTQGTLLSYKCPTGDVIRLAMMQDIFFVSFWDEYGVSVGMTAVPALLHGKVWNHVVVIRQYATGNIQIYRNGELMEDLDDDFPNSIQLPTAGILRLGKGQRDTELGFRGHYSCFQFFDVILTPDDVRNIHVNCQPDSWSLQQEKITLEKREVNGEERQCLTNYIPNILDESTDAEVKALNCDVLGLHCLTGSVAWQTVMRKHKWVDSGKAVAYYYMIARGRLPTVAEEKAHLLGKVSVSDHRVCSRLCMRIAGCRSYAVNVQSPFGAECYLYDSVLEPKEASVGTRYYAMRIDTKG